MNPERVRRAAEAHWSHEARCDECGPLTDEDYAYMAATLAASGYPSDLERALDALREWMEVVEEDCRFDHHGYCQAHYVDSPCRVAVARAVLADSDRRDGRDDMSAQPCFTCGRVTYADPPFCSQACADEFDPPDRTFPTAACGGPVHGRDARSDEPSPSVRQASHDETRDET